MKTMRRLVTAGLLVSGVALFAACGSGGPSVQARQTGETTTTTEPTTTTQAPSTTQAPATTAAPPTTAAAPVALPCTLDALSVAYTTKFGAPKGSLALQKCVSGWATSALSRGFDPPTFTLYRAEGDHWVAVNSSPGKLCEGQGVPADIAPQIGCDT